MFNKWKKDPSWIYDKGEVTNHCSQTGGRQGTANSHLTWAEISLRTSAGAGKPKLYMTKAWTRFWGKKTTEDLVTRQHFSEFYLQKLPGLYNEDRKLQNVCQLGVGWGGGWRGLQPCWQGWRSLLSASFVLSRPYLTGALPSMIFSEPSLPQERDMLNSSPFQPSCPT